MEGVDMNTLTEAERDVILSVIRRNDQLQQAEQQRISKLQSEVKFIRLKGVIKPGQDAAKSCARCRTPFGWFFNKGTICPQCQHRICETCRVPLDQPGKWLCVLCHKQMQLQAMTGDWFYSKFRMSKRHKRTNKVITGSEIVRTSIRRPNRPNRFTTATGAANTIGQEVKRALSNNNALAKAQLPPNSTADGESSDTQSMEDSYSPRRQLQKDLEGSAYPKDSDRQKLFDLIRPKMPDSEFANGRSSLGANPQVRVEVKKVSSNRYSDSDSSSDSENSNPSPPFSQTADSFMNSESIRSSFRSTVSAISSEGPNTVVTEGISDLDIPTCSSASVSPTVFRKDVTSPSYRKEVQPEKQYSSDKSRSNPCSSRFDGDGLLGISPTQSKTEIQDAIEKQPKQVTRRTVTKQDSLADSSDSEGEFTTEQITRMKFRRISVSKTEVPKSSSTKDQNSLEVASSTETPDAPPYPEVIITQHDPSPALELTGTEPAPTPPEADTPCAEIVPQPVEPSLLQELEPEPDCSTTTEHVPSLQRTEEGAESLCGQQGGETGGVSTNYGGGEDTSPLRSSLFQHSGGGVAKDGGTFLQLSRINFPATSQAVDIPRGGGATQGCNVPTGGGLATLKEPLTACPSDTNTALVTKNEKEGNCDSDRLLSNSSLSANVLVSSSVHFDAKHSGSCEVSGEGVPSGRAGESAQHGELSHDVESSENTDNGGSTRERVGALLERLGRKLGQNEGCVIDSKANEVFDDDSTSETSLDELAASNADFDDMEWDSGLISRQGEISELEATSMNGALMRELRTTGPVQIELQDFDDDTDVKLCHSVYRSADTHGDLLDDDCDYEKYQQVASYYVCATDDDSELAIGGYSSNRLDPNLLNMNQDAYSDRLSIISEQTEPQESDSDDGDSDSDVSTDDPNSSLNTTVIRCPKQNKETCAELDESVSSLGTCEVSSDSRAAPARLEKTDTIDRLADEADVSDSEETFDLSKMVERNKDIRALSWERDSQTKKDKMPDKQGELLCDVAGTKDSGNRKQHFGSTETSQFDAAENIDEAFVKETVQKDDSVISEYKVTGDARQNQQEPVSQEKRHPFPLLKQDTLSRLALEAESNDTDDALDLSLMVENNAVFAADDEVPQLEKPDKPTDDKVDASKKTQTTVINDKIVNKTSSGEVVVSKPDGSIEMKSPPVERITEVQSQQAEPEEQVSTQKTNVPPPPSEEHTDTSKRCPLLLRRDTLTTMALEAIEDGSGDGDYDLANMLQQNKQFVTDTEVASIMREEIVGIKQQDKSMVAKTSTKPLLPKDEVPAIASSTSEQKSVASKARQVSDSKQYIKKRSRGGKDEAVDTSHAPSMSQLMKVFNQPQKFMVPKVAEAYCQKDADLCTDEVTDHQTWSGQEEFNAERIQESVQSFVEHGSLVKLESETVVASGMPSEESCPVKQERTSPESQVMVKHNALESRQTTVENQLDDNTSMDVKPNLAGEIETALHVSFHELEGESSTDGAIVGTGQCADVEDSVSSEKEEDRDLEIVLKSRFGVLDEESGTEDVTPSDNRAKVLLRVPSIIVTLVDDDTATVNCVEEVTDVDSMDHAVDAAEEIEPEVMQSSANTDASLMSVLQGIMLVDQTGSGGDAEEAHDGADKESQNVTEKEQVGESLKEDAENNTHNVAKVDNVDEAQEEDAEIEKHNVAVMKQFEETMENTAKNKNKTVARSDAEKETVNVAEMEQDDKSLVDYTDEQEQNDTAEKDTKVAEHSHSADRQVKQSSLMLVDEQGSSADPEKSNDEDAEDEIHDFAEKVEKHDAVNDKENEKVGQTMEEDTVNEKDDVAERLQKNDAVEESLEEDAGNDKHAEVEDVEVAQDADAQLENKNNARMGAEKELVNVSETGKDDKALVDNADKEDKNDTAEKVDEDNDSANTQIKPSSLASLDITVDENSKGSAHRSNLELFLTRGHLSDLGNTSNVEETNTTIGGQPTLLSMASQLAVTLVKGVNPESESSPASSLHAASPPPAESHPAQSSPLVTEIPTEGSKYNGRSPTSSKSSTKETETHHNLTGSDAEADIVVAPGDTDTQRPRSPSSIPSPAMMRSKRALEGVCELDEDRQSSDSYSMTPRTDSPSSMSSHYSRGQQSNRSTNLLTPFSVSTESMMSYYSDAGEGNYGKIPVTGEIQFGLDYNYKNSVFEVAIRQCRDVAAVDTKRKKSDPYVKTYLLPDRTKNGKRKTRVKKHTLNPVFDEILKYQVTKSELETRTLWVTVWHNDTFGRNDFLGEVTLPLDYYEFGDSSPQWYKLQERNPLPLSLLTYKGDLNLSLMFVSAENLTGRKKDGRCGSKGSLHVLIKQARNLTAVRANGSSDPFCKGYLLPDKIRRVKQKTPVLKKNCNPTWNHTMVFENVSWEELRDFCLELTIWDYDRFTSNDFLGGVRLNLGSGKSSGKEVDWMDAKGDEISIWQSMLDRPNYWIDGTLMVRPNMDRRK